ncbi:tellurite resistance TerB family protein [Rhizobium alvei]|uniref:TerB family tellurite resistance protein n=1 Tax=Rhizobium alvei TaxID=1132659 RepID=A0ABT8YMQ8_9HYPH|nr:TerB family tellurite resistance protein [Rhizobium alvei]MDO6964886.1 TerB family tellurite resistance protein [Rhizobium alvei]
MFEKLMAFLGSLGAEAEKPDQTDDPSVAVVALALSVINADGVVDPKERQVLEDVIRARFNLSKVEFEAKLAAAERAEERAVDLYHFTSRLNRSLDERQKTEFIGMLWQIVHADNDRNELEDHLIWRIAELIGVSGRDRVTRRMDADKNSNDQEN